MSLSRWTGATPLTLARYLIHNPFFAKSDEDLQAAWKAMEEVQRSGKARAIGVSSFLRPQMDAILAVATIKPVVNQIEFHPYLQRADGYVAWLQGQGIAVQSFYGLAPLTHATGGPLDGPLAAMAKKYGVDPSAVVIRWQLNQNIISISTSRKPERLQQYFEALDLDLSPEDMDEITRVGRTHHFRHLEPGRFAPDDRS
jgi:diketogulonate reductase-like aldo/keto reductase